MFVNNILSHRHKAKWERPCTANSSVSDKQRPSSAMTHASCGSFGRPLSPNPLEQLILAEDTSMEVKVLCLTVSWTRSQDLALV
jgi:hypothetical protein